MTLILVMLSFVLIVAGVGLWSLWQRFIQPRCLPEAEIERCVRALLVHDGDPLRKARIETYQAWLEGDLKAQGKWRRVERALKKRLPA